MVSRIERCTGSVRFCVLTRPKGTRPSVAALVTTLPKIGAGVVARTPLNRFRLRGKSSGRVVRPKNVTKPVELLTARLISASTGGPDTVELTARAPRDHVYGGIPAEDFATTTRVRELITQRARATLAKPPASARANATPTLPKHETFSSSADIQSCRPNPKAYHFLQAGQCCRSAHPKDGAALRVTTPSPFALGDNWLSGAVGTDSLRRSARNMGAPLSRP